MGAVVAAVIGSALIGAGASYYQSEQQRKTAREQQARLDAERARQEAEAKRIAKETRPDGETLGDAIKFGSQDPTTSALSDFLVQAPTQKSVGSGLGTANKNSGLGFII